MNSIDKNIFKSYETVATALLNDLATEVRTKGKKARVLKGEGYYVKYDGVKYDITAEQCRIYRLIRNNYNMFMEHLNSAKSDILGVWKNVWGDRLPVIIADLENGLEICQMYFDAFKAYITEDDEVMDETSETEVTSEVTATVATESEDVDVDRLIRELRLNGVISAEDKIIVNEDETGIDIDVYENGRWRTNIVLYEYV